MLRTIPLAAVAAFLLAAPASAAIPASATTDVNMRGGPGPEFPVIHVIAGNDAVDIDGCIVDSQWCMVSHGGMRGWVYAAYLTTTYAGGPVMVGVNLAALGLATFTADAAFPYYQQVAVVAPAPAPAPIVTYSTVSPVIVSPAPVLVEPIVPPLFVQTFIRSSPLATAYITTPLFIGQTLPLEIVLVEVPAYQYGYAYVNGLPVLVDPATRQVVYIAA